MKPSKAQRLVSLMLIGVIVSIYFGNSCLQLMDARMNRTRPRASTWLDLIQNGMTDDEVLEKFGRPDLVKDEPENNLKAYFYFSGQDYSDPNVGGIVIYMTNDVVFTTRPIRRVVH